MKKILIIGSLNMDIVLSIESMPVTGETVMGKSLSYSHGGKGANQAYAAGMLGGNAIMLGCVGDDGFGSQLVENLSLAKVDVSRIRRSKTQTTGTAVINVDEKGNNTIVVIAGANGECDRQYLIDNDDAFIDCDYVVLQMEIPAEAVYYAIIRAKELGKTVILNPAPAPDGIPAEILEKLDYITPNESELQKLSGHSCETIEDIKESSDILLGRGVGSVLVTVGKQGALLSSGNSKQIYPAIEVAAIDTTAAGDCFNAAFVVALAEGKPVPDAIAFANTAAAISVSRPGAQASIPSRSEVDGK